MEKKNMYNLGYIAVLLKKPGEFLLDAACSKPMEKIHVNSFLKILIIRISCFHFRYLEISSQSAWLCLIGACKSYPEAGMQAMVCSSNGKTNTESEIKIIFSVSAFFYLFIPT